MWIGDVVDNRFALERPVGSGGMGTVFLATDRLEARSVAVKVMDRAGKDAADRFRREARVLAELAHPCIVRYVAHGETPDGELYLVMEWLRGEELSTRIAGGALSVEDALAVTRRVAEGLAQAHARGIVHRDVKPSNVLLVDGDPRKCVLLDFGIARVAETRVWTRTGTILGTVGYMAPEQARGDGEIDARADVFALGCMLFECLTGKPAFSGPHELAVLAKLIAGETPHLAHHRPELGADLDELLARALAQEPSLRPSDAGAFCDALDALPSTTLVVATVQASMSTDASTPSQRGITGSERRVRSVLFADPWPQEEQGSTMTPDALIDERGRLDPIARKFGAESTWLRGSRVLFAFSGARSATDLAVLAVSCAAELRANFCAAKIAVATGTADTGSDVAIGPVIDRVALLLASVEPGLIALDNVSAGLLPARFVVASHDGVAFLERVVALDDEPRPLMGRRTPCVGRERELRTLEAMLDSCIADSVSGAAIVIGDAGMGKTRLRQEFIARARRRHPTLTVLNGRGELIAATSPLVLARQLVRSAFSLLEGGSSVDASTSIRADIDRLFADATADDIRRIDDFLGELVGAQTSETPSIQLQAAREDPSLMAQWLKRTFVEWIGALAKGAPVLVVVDDLHWADSPSVAWLDEALRAHTEVPLGVLGLGRPEGRERVIPFAEQQEIVLSGLKRRSAEDLVRTVLPDANAAQVANIVEQAGGNAFYLEELCRHLASGESDLPPTIVAMAQARLEELDPDARAVLRAASVFGERFWAAGVAAILGERHNDARRWLELLASDELVAKSGTSRLADAEEYVFRHALVREAAYTALTDDDRRTAHLLAARWLDSAGESDAMRMIEHYERGGAAAEAVQWYIAAADSTMRAGGWETFESLVHGGLPLATGEDRNTLRAQHALALVMLSRHEEARRVILDALPAMQPGSYNWILTLTELAAACTFLGDPVTAAPFLVQLVDHPADLERFEVAQAMYQTYWFAATTGRKELAKKALAKAEQIGRSASHVPLAHGWVHLAMAMAAYFEARCFPCGFSNARRASEAGRITGYGALFELGRLLSVRNAIFIGAQELAAEELTKSVWSPVFTPQCRIYALMLELCGDDPSRIEAAAVAAMRTESGTTEIQARTLLGLAYCDAGRPDDAERTLDAMPASVSGVFGHRADIDMARARIALARGDGKTALAHCDEGDAAVEQWGSYVIIRQLIALSRAEALRMLGRADESKDILVALRDEIQLLAEQMDESTRASYLSQGFPSARILSAARDAT